MGQPTTVRTPVQELRVPDDGGALIIMWPPDEFAEPTEVVTIRRVLPPRGVSGGPSFRSLHLDGFQYAVILADPDTVEVVL